MCLIHIYAIIDVFSHGSWSELSEVTDPELKELAGALPLLALQGRAPTTVKKYAGAFCRWRRWAAEKSELTTSLPPKPIHIALYLSFLVQHSNTSTPI